ncbi:MAG: MBL fold metallo-hydrolase RNA specificity domain-containing protein [Candidatus Freyarchaeum deiterrae]
MSVTIKKSGAIFLDKVACDGYFPGHKIRVITHVHSDHLLGIEESIRDSDLICVTSATKDLLEVMKGLYPPQIITPNYKTPFSYEEDTITLFPSEHILGAAQVLVETLKGDKYFYSSDFIYEKIQATECDILVLDATYGHPSCIRPPFSRVKDELISLVRAELENKSSVIIFGFYGKLQEAMSLLHEAKIETSFINPPKVYSVSKIYEKYNIPLGEFYSSQSEMGRKILKSQQYIGFYHPSVRPRVFENSTYIHLTGWQFKIPCKKTGPKEYVVSFSGHSDFNQLIEYVKKCKPKLVITDNARPGSAPRLAEEIKARLGIEAKPEPSNNTQQKITSY